VFPAARSLRCYNGACKTGVLLRAEKTAEGMKGVYVSLTEGDIASYLVLLDTQGMRLVGPNSSRGLGL